MYCYNCMKKIEEGTLCTSCMIESDYVSKAHHLKPGTMLNKKYFVGNVIGEGGFGITYIGYDTMLDIKVAVKEYFPNGCANRNHGVTSEIEITTEKQQDFFDKGKERFLVEARSIARFSREQGIVGVRDYFEENGTAYIIMEYLEGQTLENYVKKNGNMDTKQLFTLMKPVMKSLQKVHNDGIIHRDISPDNIMYLKDGTLKLMDFGAARHFTNEERNMSVVLKMGYAPEEQYRKNGTQGPWTDVYGMCATMYRCITGKVPEDALDRLYEDSLKKPSSLGIEIPRLFEVVLMYGLAVHRKNRCKDMAELLDLTDKVLKKEEINLHQNSPVSNNDLYKTQAADEIYKTQAADELYDEAIQQKHSEHNSVDTRYSDIPATNASSKSGGGMVVLITVGIILVAVLAMVLGGLIVKNFVSPESTSAYEETNEEVEDTEEEEVESTQSSEKPVQEEVPPQNNVQQQPNAQDFVLPESSTRYLTKADLVGLTAEDCRVARNEIYARHGRMFKDEGLQNYFSSFSWYVPTILPDDFQESMLNEYEIANRDLIVQYETEQGYR